MYPNPQIPYPFLLPGPMGYDPSLFPLQLPQVSPSSSSSESDLNKILSGIGRIEDRLGGIESRVSSITDRLASLEGRLGTLDGSLRSVDTRMGTFDSRLERIETRLGNVEGQMGHLRQEVEKKREVIPLHQEIALETGWIKKSLRLESFQFSLLSFKVPDAGFDFPLILRVKGKKIFFNLTWIGDQDFYKDNMKGIESRIVAYAKLFFKDFEKGTLCQKWNIPKEHISVVCHDDLSIDVTLTLDDYFPPSSRVKNFITIGLGESDASLEPDLILLEDCYSVAKLIKGEGKFFGALDFLISKISHCRNASWYPRLERMFQEIGKGGKNLSALKAAKQLSGKKRPRSEKKVPARSSASFSEPSAFDDESISIELSEEKNKRKKARFSESEERKKDESPKIDWSDSEFMLGAKSEMAYQDRAGEMELQAPELFPLEDTIGAYERPLF